MTEYREGDRVTLRALDDSGDTATFVVDDMVTAAGGRDQYSLLDARGTEYVLDEWTLVSLERPIPQERGTVVLGVDSRRVQYLARCVGSVAGSEPRWDLYKYVETMNTLERAPYGWRVAD